MVISTRVRENIEKGKYSGAIIMAYNLSPEKFIFDPKDADIVQNNGNNLHKIEFSFNNHIV
ncbi:hypothetical protein C1645_820777 [Glomus cerebriforme]|uniref:Uncharacterized protein n=1 Tax=Glomus cerebriforme TaxID=658196 RepID=A0A397T2G6_9GLOM|nr:hypothetical protein C1645_820777 [Glomus cerebriforme]